MNIDSKPKSMSMKDFLIRVQAVKMMKSEKTIEAVVNHQFQSMNIAMRSNNSVELSGFGKFYFNIKKAKKRLANLIEKRDAVEKQLLEGGDSLADNKRKRLETIMTTTLLDIEFLKSKTNEFQSDLRGMEEQVDSSLGYEEPD
jgi:nucleoid DNA-binding protein